MLRRSRTRVSPSPSMADQSPIQRVASGKGKRVAWFSPGNLWRSLRAKVFSVFSLVSVSSPANSIKSASMRQSSVSSMSQRSVSGPIHESHKDEAFRE